MTVYLLHFRAPLVQKNGRKVQHYYGSAEDLDKRLILHRLGRSKAKLPTAMFRAGIAFDVARTWEGGVRRERQLKKQGSGRRKCTICNPEMKTHPEPYQRRQPPLAA